MVPVGSHVEKGLSVEFHRAVVRTERLAVAQGRSLRQPDLRSVQQPEGFGFAAGIGERIVRFHGRLVHVVADEVAAHDERNAQHGGGAPASPAYDTRTLGAVRRRIRVDAGVQRLERFEDPLRIVLDGIPVAHAPQSPDFAKLGFVGFGLGNPAQNVLFFGRSRVSLQILINKFVFQNNIGLRLDFGYTCTPALVAPYNGSQHLALYQ